MLNTDFFDRIEIQTIAGRQGSLPREVMRKLGFAVDRDAVWVTTSQLKILKQQEGWEDAEAR